MNCEIKLSRGKKTIVDHEDYEKVIGFKWKWFCQKTKCGNLYASANFLKNGKKSIIQLQRFLMNPPPGMFVDHVNGNGLDNRRENLRICTSAQNSRNRRPLKGKKTSKYKGVSWHSQDGLWRAVIRADFKYKSLGLYKTQEEAAKAYDKASREYFGEFARTNF